MARLSSDELGVLEDAFARLLQDRCTEQHVRAWMEDRRGYDTELWRAIAEMGITSLLVEDRFGGAGAGIIAVERIMEHAGGVLFGAPLLASAVMSVTALQASGDEEVMARLLPELASGEKIATLLVTSREGDWTKRTMGLSASRSDDGWSLTGVASYVLHGRASDLWLAIAGTDGGPTLFEVMPDARGVGMSSLPSFDRTLVLDEIALDRTPASQVGEIGNGWQAVQHAIDFGLIALAGEQAGGARRIFDLTVEYARLRHQFGRAIGSFQAIKHMAADLLLELESAVSAARQAAAATDDDATDAPAWRFLAGFACADAYSRIAADAVQMHGGIAFTWEHPAHLYLRRSRADAQLLGTPDYYREQYLRAVGG